ncbi:MAG: DNA polymerase III subunit beta [Candidatus Poribacteria bacterium]|nr:DNA polymerase III subunit beta [Candidatus Poribacteria bacterium]
MELTFEKHDLLHALQILQSVASGRNTLPILSNVLIQATDGNIECVATDLEVGIKIKVEGAIQEDGAITVSAKKLADIVKELPEDKTIHLVTTANDRVEITCGDGVYKIIGLPDEEFPQLPSVDGHSLTIDGETLRAVIRRTEFAAATEDVRYYLNGLYFSFLEDKTEVVATDMTRLALAQCEPFETPENVEGFIVPLKAVKEIERTFAESDKVQISVLENQVLLADDKATLTTRLVEGDYPKYQALIPESATGRAVVSKEQFLQASRRVALLSNPKSYAICLEISTEQIHLSTNTPELGEAHETISVESCNGRERIGLDARLLIETLSHIETESVAIEFTTAVTTVAFKPVGEEGHVCLIHPMRLGS